MKKSLIILSTQSIFIQNRNCFWEKGLLYQRYFDLLFIIQNLLYTSNINLNLCRTVVSSWELNSCFKTLTFHFRLVGTIKSTQNKKKKKHDLCANTFHNEKKTQVFSCLIKKTLKSVYGKYKKKNIFISLHFDRPFGRQKNILHRKSKGSKRLTITFWGQKKMLTGCYEKL